MEKKTDFSGFTNYKQTVIELTKDLSRLMEFSERLALQGNKTSLEEVMRRLEKDSFCIAIIGEFNRGKSTLINALLGKDVLPMNILPTTAILNKIAYSITPFVTIEYNNGSNEQIPIEALNDYVTKLTKESEERAKSIKEATVYYPINYCKNGVTIIDTPGLNDDQAMTQVTMSVLPKIDAALMVIMAQSPFSESERSFLEEKIITSDLGRILFVVTGIDLLDEEDVDVVLDHIRNTIKEHIIKKAESTYGKGSKEYDSYIQKLGRVHVYGISAKKALKAKMKGDQEMLERSCFPTFELALEKFLTQERGAITLSVPVNRIRTSSIEILKAIQLRKDALSMEKEDFDRNYELALSHIEQIRKDRKLEFEHINESAEATYSQLQPQIVGFWPALTKAAQEAIDECKITSDDLKEDHMKQTQERMLNAVKQAISSQGQILTERIQSFINNSLAEEAKRLSGFEKNFYEATERIQNLFRNGIGTGGTGSATVISTVTNSVIGYGLGGMYMGYKEAGWKGALLGGATGFAGMAVGNIGLFSVLLPALSIPITWPIMIIGGIAVGLLSTFSSKFALNKVFAKDRIEKFKESVKTKVVEELDRMKAENNFSITVKEQIGTAFSSLKDKIRTETERILNDTQAQLTQLKVERAQMSLTREKETAELQGIINALDDICNRAENLGKQLCLVLDQ